MIDVTVTIRVATDGWFDSQIFADNLLSDLQQHDTTIVAVNVEEWYEVEEGEE